MDDADFDADGVSVGADALTLGSGDAITDSQGQNAGLAHAELSDNPAHRVNMSTVTIVAAGTEPVPEDESALYAVQRTGSLSRALTVHLDYVLDDNLSDSNPDVYSGEGIYVFDSFVPRTVTFQPGRSTAPVAVRLHDDAEIEIADGSLTMIVSGSADYLVGQPDSATRILQDNNDVPVDMDIGLTGGRTTERSGAVRPLKAALGFETSNQRDKPPDPFYVSLSTVTGTAGQRPRGSNDGGDFIGVQRHVLIEPSAWKSRTTNEGHYGGRRSRNGLPRLPSMWISWTTTFPSRSSIFTSISKGRRARR